MIFKLESDEGELCTESYETSLLPLASCFELCDIQRFHCQKVCAINKQRPIMLHFLPAMLLPIMLNIMPMTTAIMPQFVYDFIIFND